MLSFSMRLEKNCRYHAPILCDELCRWRRLVTFFPQPSGVLFFPQIETLARLGQLTEPESQKMEDMYYEQIHHNMAVPLEVQQQVMVSHI